MTGTADDDGFVIGEGLLPPPQFLVTEGEVAVAPDDQCGQCCDTF